MTRILTLFGLGCMLVQEFLYAWASVLRITIRKFFSIPSQSQIVWAYPKSVPRTFGHANIFVLLDATKIDVEVASMKTVNTLMYSLYKHV